MPRAVSQDAITRLAALARVLETVSAGDARVLARELVTGLEALAGPVATVIPIGQRR